MQKDSTFKYGDRVYIVRGFYREHFGYAESQQVVLLPTTKLGQLEHHYDTEYSIRLEGTDKSVLAFEDMLKLAPINPSTGR